MKVTCPACQTIYRIAEDRLNGRRGKVRCKRCGDSFLVDPARPSEEVYARRTEQGRARDTDLFAGISTAGAEQESVPDASALAASPHAPLVGERNESSVLFSLAALSRQAPAPRRAEPTDSSALIDLRALTSTAVSGDKSTPAAADIANLGGGGAFAPLFAPPVTFTPADPEEPTRRRRGMGVLLATAMGVVVVAVVAVAVFVGVRSRSSAPEAAPATRAEVARTPSEPAVVAATAASEASPPPNAPSVPIAMASTSKKNVTSTRSVTPPPADSRAVASRGTPSPPANSEKCCSGESEIACRMRLAAGAACGAETTSAPVFDRLAATRALGLDVASCKRADGPTGAGHVKVTFQPNGTVSAVDVDAPYAGTPTGACIAQRYRRVSVPAFSGGPLTVGKNFVIE